jgi:hypothetical protein
MGLINVCIETNLMHYLSSVYSVTILLHVSGLLVAHHQEVTMHMQPLVRVVRFSSLSAGLVGMERTICCVYTLLPPDDRQMASPKHIEV